MTTFFTSDEHYGHKNIITHCSRPYGNVDEMNSDIIARHNAVVKPGDWVYHIGDFSMNEKYVPEILKALNGDHCLIPGNHDACYPKHRRYDGGDAINRYLGYGFKWVENDYLYSDAPEWQKKSGCVTGSALYVLNHVPWHSDEYEDKRPERAFHRPEEYLKGLPLLHGHVHNAWKKNGSMWNVGVDVWGFKPVTLEELKNG